MPFADARVQPLRKEVILILNSASCKKILHTSSVMLCGPTHKYVLFTHYVYCSVRGCDKKNF
jgi:hypothetical protein